MSPAEPSDRAGGVRVAVLTGAGRGAIGVVVAWGDRALEMADAAFRPRRSPGLAAMPAGRPRVGSIGRGAGDEVVAVRLDSPPHVEIQCHGGPAAVALVVESLTVLGARRARPIDWFQHLETSPVRAAARMDLTRAPTMRVAGHLLDQAEGALDRALWATAAALRSAEPVDRDRGARRLSRLVLASRVGCRLLGGWRVALAGLPNAGKSSLFNALLGHDRAIVHHEPGTTRDVVTACTALDGWPVELADTAGLRDVTEPVERAGVARARATHQDADLTLILIDVSTPWCGADRALLDAHPKALVVATKADLAPAWDPGGVAALAVSARTGEGLDALATAIAQRLVPRRPRPGAPLPWRRRQRATLRRAQRLVIEDRWGEAAGLISTMIQDEAQGAVGSDPSEGGIGT